MGPQGPVGQFTQALGLGRLPFTFAGLVVASVLYSMSFVVQPLQQAFEAIPAGGCLIAVDNLIDDDRRTNAFGLLMSLNMLIEFGSAFDYSGADFDGWACAAGFARTEVIALAGPGAAAVAWKEQ